MSNETKNMVTFLVLWAFNEMNTGQWRHGEYNAASLCKRRALESLK